MRMALYVHEVCAKATPRIRCTAPRRSSAQHGRTATRSTASDSMESVHMEKDSFHPPTMSLKRGSSLLMEVEMAHVCAPGS